MKSNSAMRAEKSDGFTSTGGDKINVWSVYMVIIFLIICLHQQNVYLFMKTKFITDICDLLNYYKFEKLSTLLNLFNIVN